MKGKRKEESGLKTALKSKRLPIVILDERWHELFPESKKPPHIKVLEDRLNELLKGQGKMINDMKEMKKLKKKLMSEIILNMETDDTDAGKRKAKKLEKSSQMIQEINTKLKENEDKLGDLPYEIKAANEELMIQSMKLCYGQMQMNTKNIEETETWIKAAREELKLRILKKQDMETENQKIYSYMHDMLGAEILNLFDKEVKS